MGSKTPHEVNEAERKSYWTLSDSTWMKEAGGTPISVTFTITSFNVVLRESDYHTPEKIFSLD
jgi:hypothetical protein